MNEQRVEDDQPGATTAHNAPRESDPAEATLRWPGGVEPLVLPACPGHEREIDAGNPREAGEEGDPIGRDELLDEDNLHVRGSRPSGPRWGTPKQPHRSRRIHLEQAGHQRGAMLDDNEQRRQDDEGA